jgi:hypothetical protein
MSGGTESYNGNLLWVEIGTTSCFMPTLVSEAATVERTLWTDEDFLGWPEGGREGVLRADHGGEGIERAGPGVESQDLNLGPAKYAKGREKERKWGDSSLRGVDRRIGRMPMPQQEVESWGVERRTPPGGSTLTTAGGPTLRSRLCGGAAGSRRGAGCNR